jgi:hypothetical protein
MRPTVDQHMRIEKIGHYITRGRTPAEVLELREAYCIGFVWSKVGTRKAAIWRIEEGTIMSGMPDEDLVEYVKPFDVPPVY